MREVVGSSSGCGCGCGCSAGSKRRPRPQERMRRGRRKATERTGNGVGMRLMGVAGWLLPALVVGCWVMRGVGVVRAEAEAEAEDASACARYSERTYMPATPPRTPALISSFAGSGNTFTRALLEFSTGHYTGSVYGDTSLLEMFPGETSCGGKTVAVKLHLEDHRFVNWALKVKANRGPCAGKGPFRKAIFVVRNPYDAIWAEYQRTVTRGSHTGLISERQFNLGHWQRFSQRYSNMFRGGMHAAREFMNARPDSYVLLRFESLVDKATRVAELRKATDFLGFPDVSDERLECAFKLASDSRILRAHPAAGTFMTKDVAYRKLDKMVCHMWGVFSLQAIEFGYEHPWKNQTCQETGAYRHHRQLMRERVL